MSGSSFTWDLQKRVAVCNKCQFECTSLEEVNEHKCSEPDVQRCHEAGHPRLKSSNECRCGQIRYDD